MTIVALSRLVGEALEAADRLAADGIEAEVIDPRTLVPLDLEHIVESVKRTNRLVVAHEAVQHGGFGAEIAAEVQAAAFDFLDAPVARVGAPFAPIPLQPAARGRLPARGRRGLRRSEGAHLAVGRAVLVDAHERDRVVRGGVDLAVAARGVHGRGRSSVIVWLPGSVIVARGTVAGTARAPAPAWWRGSTR